MTDWRLRGELVINCNCDVFCPCVASLGRHRPTQGYCQAWGAVAVEEGHFEGHSLDGARVGLMLDIPGRMTEGNWSLALYVDKDLESDAVRGLERIFTGKAGGATRILELLISSFLGSRAVDIEYRVDGRRRMVRFADVLDAAVEPVPGADPSRDVVLTNSRYWMSPDVVLSQAEHAKFRDFGRVWDLGGRSAELCSIDWSG